MGDERARRFKRLLSRRYRDPGGLKIYQLSCHFVSITTDSAHNLGPRYAFLEAIKLDTAPYHFDRLKRAFEMAV